MKLLERFSVHCIDRSWYWYAGAVVVASGSALKPKIKMARRAEVPTIYYCKYIRINAFQLRVSFFGAGFKLNDMKFTISKLSYNGKLLTWSKLFSRLEKHVAKEALGQIPGNLGKRKKTEAELLREERKEIFWAPLQAAAQRVFRKIGNTTKRSLAAAAALTAPKNRKHDEADKPGVTPPTTESVDVSGVPPEDEASEDAAEDEEEVEAVKTSMLFGKRAESSLLRHAATSTLAGNRATSASPVAGATASSSTAAADGVRPQSARQHVRATTATPTALQSASMDPMSMGRSVSLHQLHNKDQGSSSSRPLPALPPRPPGTAEALAAAVAASRAHPNAPSQSQHQTGSVTDRSSVRPALPPRTLPTPRPAAGEVLMDDPLKDQSSGKSKAGKP